MKARAGVTLVELLVVMLIAVILAISLLPMFKEYICKAQYNAEAVPVIATLRTKISLYQYDHGRLPPNVADETVASWEINQTDNQKYDIATYTLSTPPQSPTYDSTEKLTNSGKDTTVTTTPKLHFADTTVLDVDYQDLRGRRSLPIDYVYYNIKINDASGQISKTDSAYVIGCFGSGEGLAAGTGYAVCELNLVSVGKKYIGTFERYKAKQKSASNPVPYLYLSKNDVGAGNPVSGDYVYCPDKIESADLVPDPNKGQRLLIITTMEYKGCKFYD